MKISEARSIYGTKIQEFSQYQTELNVRKKELDEKIKTTSDGKEVYANEAAVLELNSKAVEKQRKQYQDYMEKLMEQWVAVANMEVAKQQGDAMGESAKEIGKVMEVARRIMDGAIVPGTDEKKLMEFSMELYQAAKNIGAMRREQEREEYESLWGDEEKKTYDDPIETADNTEVFAEGPKVVSVGEVVSKSENESRKL